jgi:hypothetical protein
MEYTGTAFLNARSSVKTAAQIYNASRKERLLNMRWQDMELAIHFCGESALFVGRTPNTVDHASNGSVFPWATRRRTLLKADDLDLI